ncbi:hypothetical protein GCM10009839_76410 [Catenulispora yoronensis]|uniref:Integral membrane protein n=1 Tax=Catenulispora yoronensis TaxID=450799 RepID=A0ABP5GUZ6_9ACTN
MTETVSARRGTLIAGISALALLILVAAFDNSGTRTWRLARMTGERDDTVHSWTATPVQALSALDWRASPASGESGRIFAGYLASALLAVLFLFLLTMLVCRGVAAGRGRWALFAGTWFATGAAAGLAVAAGSAIAGTSLVLSAFDPAGTRFARGDTYYAMLTAGMLFGLFAGWLIGLVAVITYGITEGSDTGGGSNASWGPPSGYEYGSATPTSGPDYSFSPGSPYSAPSSSPPSSTPEYGGYGSPSAPTQIVPPRDGNPYHGDDDSGGGSGDRSY